MILHTNDIKSIYVEFNNFEFECCQVFNTVDFNILEYIDSQIWDMVDSCVFRSIYVHCNRVR